MHFGGVTIIPEPQTLEECVASLHAILACLDRLAPQSQPDQAGILMAAAARIDGVIELLD
jgi:hypothetical protein